MGIESDSPKIALLRLKIETIFGKAPKVHNDFMLLSESIENKLREHISETTLERVWRYSNRGYGNVSLHTLDLLCRYLGLESWEKFCLSIKDIGLNDSDMFAGESIFSKDLKVGDRLEIGWLPDRKCVIEYLGDNNFIAVKCENSTMQPGDYFSCLEFFLYQPCIMENFISPTQNDENGKRYVAGVRHGLTTLKKVQL